VDEVEGALRPSGTTGDDPARIDPRVLRDAVETANAVGESRRRLRVRLPSRHLGSGVVTGGSFLVTLLVWLLVRPPDPDILPILALCVALHAVASAVQFEIGPGLALPTTPLLVVAAFLVPPPCIPVIAFGGAQLAAAAGRAVRPGEDEDPLSIIGTAWHAFGPALAFAWAAPGAADLGDWPVVVVALALQMSFDAGIAWLQTCYGFGVPIRQLATALRFTFLIDVLLAPIGFVAALAAPGSAWSLAFLAPVVILLGVLQRDRRMHIDQNVQLAEAYGETVERARRDVLTGLRNRLAWEEALAELAGSPMPVGVVLADADGLKLANDRHGHEMGDRLLCAIGAVLAAVRPDEAGAVAARLGGDEFGILLPGRLAASAEAVADALRSALLAAPDVEDGVPVRASVGSGLAVDGAEIAAAMEEADRGVYEEKAKSRFRRM
jgi:diguanylate cyclase (GGDEF)-like protein